jgi:hypothetical protein
MKPLTRKEPRACVALVLILTLLGLGALDTVICRGSDGHIGIDTRISSCCSSGVARVSSADSDDQVHTSSMDHSNGNAACTDTPLVQGTPAVHHHNPAAGCLASPITVSYPALVSPIHRGPATLICSGSILSHLRSTTLLI